MKGTIKTQKVQLAFNHAIVRRDNRCRIRDYEPCSGRLECSHFHTVGSTNALRFYPYNAFAQCSLHHHNHHTKKEDKDMYRNWLLENYPKEFAYMESVKNNYIKYTDEVKANIISFCNNDNLEGLADYLKELL